MTKYDEPERPFKGQGNYLGKQRRNFYISNRCWDMMHDLSLEIGINHSAIIELSVREMYCRYKGEVPPIAYTDFRRPK